VVVRNVVVKFVEERAVASLSLRSIEVHSAGAQWQRACVEPEGPSRRMRKTVTSLSVESKLAQPSASWHSPRPAGSPEAAFSARADLRLPGASVSLGQSAAWSEPAGRPFRACFSAQVTLSDLTLCLDEQEKGSSRVAHFQHPLLRRASLVARIDMHLRPSERPEGATTLLLDVLCPAACWRGGLLLAPPLGIPASSDGAGGCWVGLWALEERPSRSARREGQWTPQSLSQSQPAQPKA
jgi:hypothetical protein